LYVFRYLVSVFSNLVSILITTLGLSGHSNRYRTTVAVIYNREKVVLNCVYIYISLYMYLWALHSEISSTIPKHSVLVYTDPPQPLFIAQPHFSITSGTTFNWTSQLVLRLKLQFSSPFLILIRTSHFVI
jgi:hypothetical protein